MASTSCGSRCGTRSTLRPCSPPPPAPRPRAGSAPAARRLPLRGRRPATGSPAAAAGGRPAGDADQAVSSEEDEAEASRLIALVELARGGDCEAFGLLYDHYHVSVYRFVYYRVGSVALAEDLTSETFFRALRSMGSFRWQGKDFGAWLMTIARNLTTDHFKAGRTRLEYATEDMSPARRGHRGSRELGARLAHQRGPARRRSPSCPTSSRSA